MTPAGGFRGLRPGLILVAGVSLGFGLAGLSGLSESELVLAFLLLVMASFGEWLEVRLGQLGAFTLRPVIAFVGLWSAGPAVLMLAGLVPVLVVRLPSKRSSLPDELARAGGDALGFWLGYLIYQYLTPGLNFIWLPASVGAVVARVASFLAFWVAQIPLQAVELRVTEGIRYRTGMIHLVWYARWHVLVLSLAAIGLTYVGANFGYIVMGIAGVALIETYYPWKLLGEQTGVLLTSLQMMAQAVDLKDPYTSNHSQRVSRYAVRIARAMGLPEDEVERIRVGGLMHDIGKIGISGRIIRKPGKLTPEERDAMNQHSLVSAQIIEHLDILGESAAMVRHHHENWDGSGYPSGLRGEEIPLGSRVIFVADAFDALVTDRPYRKGASRAEAFAVIRKNSGTQFDPTVVDAMERISSLL